MKRHTWLAVGLVVWLALSVTTCWVALRKGIWPVAVVMVILVMIFLPRWLRGFRE